MKFSSRERVLLALVVVLSISLLFGGRGIPISVAKEDKDGSALYEDLKTFTDVLAVVQRDYYRQVGSEELIKGAIKGMLTSLDPHSGYLDPEFYTDLQVQTKGEFGGLGIEITIKDGLLIVVAPMEGSPAERAGILPGDAIVKIEGKFTKEFSLVDAVKRLRGKKGTPIDITIHRKGVPDLLDVTIVRDRITVKSVRSRSLGGGFGYARVSQFMESTGDDLRDALDKLASQSEGGVLKGLVLDLRNNPGGLLTQAIRVSDLFLKEGVIVYTDGRVEAQKQKFFAHERGTEFEYPVIVLVNGGSASASEIVAGALKDHGRGLVLGTKTFGKGSVQTITPLGNGGALTLTTALYFTKSGRSIQAEGIEPDIVMQAPTAEESIRQERLKKSNQQSIREGDLPGAIRNPSDRQGKESRQDESEELLQDQLETDGDLHLLKPENMSLEELLKRDAQLARALDLLKTFTIFRGSPNPIQAVVEKEAA